MTADWHGTPRIPLQISRDVVIASVQTDLTEDVLARFSAELLGFIHRHAAAGVVVDFSGVDIVDATEFAELRKLLDMAALLGARPMVAGLSPGIISSLIDAGADIDGIAGALHVDDALSRLRGEADVLKSEQEPNGPQVSTESLTADGRDKTDDADDS